MIISLVKLLNFYSVGKGQEMHVQFSALSDLFLFYSVGKGQEMQVQFSASSDLHLFLQCWQGIGDAFPIIRLVRLLPFL
jgi:hypothetical protein